MENVQNPIQIHESSSTKADGNNNNNNSSEVEELLQRLDKKIWHGFQMCKYKNSWCPVRFLGPTIACEKYFKARDTDIILATLPKSGTTWLKALTFSIVTRSRYPLHESPLLISNPQFLIRSLQQEIYKECENPDLSHILDPRIFSTHVHYEGLPSSIIESKCRIIHICRNPLDQFVSLWHFLDVYLGNEPVPLEEFLETYCAGTHFFGPFWELVLGYWNAYTKNPEKVLFLKYEDLKKDINFNVKRIAEFIGFPFSSEEENSGLIEEVAKLCSFGNLKSLEVNQVGFLNPRVQNKYFFRKGEVGDWANYLSPSMVQRIEKVVEEKFRGSGLMF